LTSAVEFDERIRRVNSATDAVAFPDVPENAILGAKLLSRRRRSKNSGGRIAPAAIEGLYRGPGFHRQRLPVRRDPERLGGIGCKMLGRLNFSGSGAIAG
jgi:hypothetical protein